MTAPSHAEAKAIVDSLDNVGYLPEPAGLQELREYIDAAQQAERERDELKAKLTLLWPIAKQAIAKGGSSFKGMPAPELPDANLAAALDASMLRIDEDSRLAAVLREHSEAIRDGLNWAISEMPPSRVEDLRKAEAAANAIAEALK